MKKIAFYGKGGIGKSTTVSNIASALNKLGYTVMQVGCDPKSDSTISHNKGKRVPSVLDNLRLKKNKIEDILYKSDSGIYLIESGGPLPGRGCAGRGIITAFEKIKELKIVEKIKPDYILYDVLGDVVCGGFATPIRNGYADDLYIISSGEMMSLYAANNIKEAVSNDLELEGYAKLKGLILNEKNIKDELEITKKACNEMKTPLFFKIKRDGLIQEAENKHQTVVDLFPDSDMAKSYLKLAKKIVEND